MSFTAADNHGGMGAMTLQVHINAPPAFTTAPPASALEDELFAYAPEATDPDGDPVKITLAQGPAGMVFDGAALTWTPVQADVGDHEVVLQADDGQGRIIDQAFTLTVVNVNDPPRITSTPTLGGFQDQEYRYQVTATDEDGDALTFSLAKAPEGMSIDPATGLVTWKPTAEQAGVHEVSVVADDGHGGTARQDFTLSIRKENRPPSITSAPVLSVKEKAEYRYDVVAVDPDGDATIFALPVAPAGMAIDPKTGRIL